MRQMGTQVNSLSFALQQSGLLRAKAVASAFDPHFHSTYSVVALRKGSAEIKSRRWSGTARAQDVLFLNAYEVHSAYCPIQDAEYATLYLTDEFLARCLTLEVVGKPINFETAILGLGSATQELCETLFDLQVDEERLELSLRSVLAECAFSTGLVHGGSGTLVRRACSLIQMHPTRAIKTENLAHELGVHKSHLVRAFSETVGIPPQSYLRQVRVAKARELICEGLELSEIAALLEFSDQAHLTREFKKVFGVPPGRLSRDIHIHPRRGGRATR